MQNRRKFWFTMFAAVAGMGLVVASVVADELFGVITKADADAKKITVVEKDTDKEVEIKITDDTEYVTKKGTGKVDFEKLEKGIEKSKENGGKGITAKITHEKGVASKIVVEKRKKKAE
jgi:signal transduction histidine kinase